MTTTKSKSKPKSEPSTALAVPAKKQTITQTALRAVSVLIHSQLASKVERTLRNIETQVYQIQLTDEQKEKITALADHIEKVEKELDANVLGSYKHRSTMLENTLNTYRSKTKQKLMIEAGYNPDPYGRFNQEQKDVPSVAEIQAKLTLTSLGKENFKDLLELVAKDYDLDIKQINGFGD